MMSDVETNIKFIDAKDNKPFAVLKFLGERLDPNRIVPLFSIAPSRRPRRKGEPMVARLGKAGPLAKTGGCFFATYPFVRSAAINDHIIFLLNEIEKNAKAIKSYVAESGVAWEIACFPPDGAREGWLVLDDAVVHRAKALGIRVVEHIPGIMTVVEDETGQRYTTRI